MSETHQPLRVFVVEPNEPARQRVARVLVEGGMRLVGEAGSLAVARSLTARTAFDVLLVELALPDGDGTELIRELAVTRPQVCSVVSTASTDEADLVEALVSGAAGYLTKDLPAARLATSIAAAARGEAPLSRAMTAVLVRAFARLAASSVDDRASSVCSQLTPREHEVLSYLAQGSSTDEIAAELVLSVATVRSHIRSVLRKLGVHTRAGAVALLVESNARIRPATPPMAA